MRRLFWVGVGVTVTVLVVRRGRTLVETYLPAGTTDVMDGVGRFTRAARTAKDEFRAGLAEREAQLAHELVGDVDVDAIRTRRSADKQARHDADVRAERAQRAARGWEHEPTDDPDDDAAAPFF